MLYAAIYLVAINLITFSQFRSDKARAIVGMRRIPEARLLQLAAIGGTPAAFAARYWMRHKSRKQPFSMRLWLIAVVQIGILFGLSTAQR